MRKVFAFQNESYQASWSISIHIRTIPDLHALQILFGNAFVTWAKFVVGCFFARHPGNTRESDKSKKFTISPPRE